MKRTFENDFEKAYYHAGRARFWAKLAVVFALLSLVATIIGAIMRANP